MANWAAHSNRVLRQSLKTRIHVRFKQVGKLINYKVRWN